MDTNWDPLDTHSIWQFQQRKCIFLDLQVSTQAVRLRRLRYAIFKQVYGGFEHAGCSSRYRDPGTLRPRVAQPRTASSYHQGYQALVPLGLSSRNVKLPTMLSVMTLLCVRGAIPPLSNVPSWCSAQFNHRNYTCLEVAASLRCTDVVTSSTTVNTFVWTYSSSVYTQSSSLGCHYLLWSSNIHVRVCIVQLTSCHSMFSASPVTSA